LVQVRLDPIKSPGISPSSHVHTVHGGYGYASNSTYDTLRASPCTSCLVSQDRSNYWFPKLYLHDPNNATFEPVPNGGLLVYYQHQGGGDVNNGGSGLKAFPPGFKMLSGDVRRRVRRFRPGDGSQGELAERALQWECLRYPKNISYNSLRLGAQGFPTTDCEGGLIMHIHMPACWDGVNVDSPDHVAHTAYLSDLDHGSCPSTHPVPLMKLLYEVTWDVTSMASRWNPRKDLWPFIWSTGDATGYSWHADFQNGWDTQALQSAIDKCNNADDQTGYGITSACSYLTVANATMANQCKQPPAVDEKVDGQLQYLPGCNPIQPGPQDSTTYSDFSCPHRISGAFGKYEGVGRIMSFITTLLIVASGWFELRNMLDL